MNHLMEEYENAKKALLDHVGLYPDWVEFPIDDCTDMLWYLISDSEVRYSETLEGFFTGECYDDEIYKQRFYEKHIFEGETLTLIFCDPHVDGMKWWRVFSNDKMIKPQDIKGIRNL